MRYVLLVIVLALGCSKTSDESQPATTDSDDGPPPTPGKSKQSGPVERLQEAKDFSGALAVTLPLMTYTPHDTSSGAKLLARWAAQHLRFEDVHVKEDETSLRKVQGAPYADRGKRICCAGDIVQISRETGGLGDLWGGFLMTDDEGMLHFLAAGSRGDLAAGSQARLCGAVTGVVAYSIAGSNAGGKEARAVQVVGMFELPENTR